MDEGFRNSSELKGGLYGAMCRQGTHVPICLSQWYLTVEDPHSLSLAYVSGLRSLL